MRIRFCHSSIQDGSADDYKEPLIKSFMNRVADKNGILAATRYRETADCGSGEGASSPHRRCAYREPMSTARRATPVAATTRYWHSQPLAGVAACCHSRTGRFAHRVMAAVILAPTIRCGRAVWRESGGSGLSRTKGLRPTVSRPLCQGAQHRERPFWPYLETALRSVLSQPSRALALRAVCCVRLRHVTAQQPIAGAAACNPLPHRTLTRTASGVLLLAKRITIRFLAFLAWPSRHVTAQQPVAGARAGRPSRTKCYAPPCQACNPAKPNARSCGT